MARKLLLIIVLVLLVGQVTAQMSNENVNYLSELYNIPAEELQGVHVPEREKRFLGAAIKGILKLGKRVHDIIRNRIRHG